MGKATWGMVEKALLRRLRGPYSQAEMGKLLDIAEPSYSEWERGISTPSPAALRALLLHCRDWHQQLDLDHRPLVKEALDRIFPRLDRSLKGDLEP